MACKMRGSLGGSSQGAGNRLSQAVDGRKNRAM